MQFTPEQERLIRAAIATTLQPAGDLFLFTDRPLITSKQDFVAKFFKTETVAPGGAVVKYALVEFARFTDTDDGCADNPVVLIGYNIHAFIEHYGAEGAAADNSHNELAAFILNARNIVLQSPNITLADSTRHFLNPLTQPEMIVTDNDTVTGLEGHYVDLQLEVEVWQ